MPPPAILEPSQIPKTVLFDQEAVRRNNPQRFEMEQLSAITLLDPVRKLVAGYKDVSEDEFWVRGHMPGFPLMPGVMMCEAAAQLCAFYCRHVGILAGDFIGFGGMDNVRFRGTVRPGQRLWLVGRTDRHSERRMVFHIQGFVDSNMVFNGDFIGVPLHRHGTSIGN
jgi:3-hydroxyacyl-[acyl-carrier-protein] dehydratase